MARKRSRAKKTRRRRVGAMALNASNPTVMMAAVAAGFLLVGKPLNDAIDKAAKLDVTPNVGKSKMIGAAEAGIGAMLLMKKGRKTLPGIIAGGVLAGAGLKRLLKDFGIMSGYQSVPVVSGYKRVPVLSGYAVPNRGGLGSYNTNPSASIMGNANGDSGLRNSNSSLLG